jgi:hypothetical protein
MEMLVRNRKTAQESSTGKNIKQNKKNLFLVQPSELLFCSIPEL